MDNLPDDIIFNICRFLGFDESKVFKNINLAIDRMILKSEIDEFNEEYVKITHFLDCYQNYYNKKTKIPIFCYCEYHICSSKMERIHYNPIINSHTLCFKCYYKFANVRSRDIKKASSKIVSHKI